MTKPRFKLKRKITENTRFIAKLTCFSTLNRPTTNHSASTVLGYSFGSDKLIMKTVTSDNKMWLQQISLLTW